MQGIITFIIVFGILVIVHEFGHYHAAKKSGILVREFSIGMGPKLFFFKKDGTTYTLRILPLGGYVRMAGAQEDTEDDLKPGTVAALTLDDNNKEVVKINVSGNQVDSNSIPVQISNADLVDDLKIEGYENGDESEIKTYKVNHDASIIEEDGTDVRIAPRDVQFQSASLSRRIITNIAGPVNNILLAIVAYILLAFMIGGVPQNSNVVGGVENNSPAQHAGIKKNDQIVAVNHKKTDNFTELQTEISKKPKKNVTLTVKRNGHKKNVTFKTKSTKSGDKSYGVIGVTPKSNNSFGAKIKYGFDKTWSTTVMIFDALKQMITGGFNINQLSGPVGIYSASSQVSKMGATAVVSFTAMLSINLAIINMLPIPALDGGKLLLNLVEGIRGKPVSERTEGIVTLIGVGFLLILMVAVTWNDIQRFFINR